MFCVCVGGGKGNGECVDVGVGVIVWVGVGVIAWVRECVGGTALIAAIKCVGGWRGGGGSVCVRV